MDPTLFCEVTLDDDQTESDIVLEDFTEDDIVLVDNDYGDTPKKKSYKRPQNVIGLNSPPAKKACRPSPKISNKIVHGVNKNIVNKNPHTPNKLTPQAANLLRSPHLSVSRTGSPQKKTAPRLQQSITWKYRQLAENQYTADIKKGEIRKNYEPEQCNCSRAEEGISACGSGCINRSTYSECDKEMCVNGVQCTNMAIQKRQYAPGLERFMTAKKGWGVRARQSVAKGSFILEYTGEICSSQEFQKRMLDRYKGDTHHYCLAMDNKIMIDAHRAGSECRFVNHSCAPNSEMEKWNVDGLSRMALFALRDIFPGEEICYDYNFSLFNTDQGQECKCGAKECRGVIGGRGKDYLITLDSQEPEQPSKTPKHSKPVINPRILEDETWFNSNLSPEELDWLSKNAPKPGQLEAKIIKCTVCNECLNFKSLSQCQRHPDLGVVICIKCKGSYGKGGWEKDPEGNDEFCRWCSEGGQIYLCDFCPHAFCNRCLRWNLGRKYLKSIEDEVKWKCLMCDTSHLKEHRALYWAIYKYHKDKPSKSKSAPTGSVTPSKGGNGVNCGKARSVSSPKVKPQLNGVKSVMTPIKKAASPASINSAYNKLQKNGAINVAPVKPVQNKIDGVKSLGNKKKEKEEKTEHFVDFMLKDADDCIKQFVNMVDEVRRMWKHSGKKKADITGSTRKLRQILDLAKQNIIEVDQKVVDSYRTNLSDADIGDISSLDSEKNMNKKTKMFSKDEVMPESLPDLPNSDGKLSGSGSETHPKDSGIVTDGTSESSMMNGSRKMTDPESEEGIFDMSVEELEEGDQESQTASAKSVLKEAPADNNVQGCLKKEDDGSFTRGTDDVKAESLEPKEENTNAAFDMEQSSCKPKLEKGNVDAPVLEDLKENTKKGVLVKEEELDVEEDKKSLSLKDNFVLPVQSNKMGACSFPEIKEIKEEINLKPEMGERSKESKLVAIEYKNEASPIKDQKDILKEKELIAGVNKGYLAHYVQKKQNNDCSTRREESAYVKPAEDPRKCDKTKDDIRQENDLDSKTQEETVTDKRQDEGVTRKAEEDASNCRDKDEVMGGNDKKLENSGIEETPVTCSNDETQKEGDNKSLTGRGDNQTIGSEKAEGATGAIDNVNNLGDQILLGQTLPSALSEQSDVLLGKDDILCSSALNNTVDTDDDVIITEVEESLNEEEACINHNNTEYRNTKLDFVEKKLTPHQPIENEDINV